MQLRPDRKINESGATDLVYRYGHWRGPWEQEEVDKTVVSKTEQDKQMTVNISSNLARMALFIQSRSEREQDLHKPAFPLFSLLISGIMPFCFRESVLSIGDLQFE
jgi:hypothetical protein